MFGILAEMEGGRQGFAGMLGLFCPHGLEASPFTAVSPSGVFNFLIYGSSGFSKVQKQKL